MANPTNRTPFSPINNNQGSTNPYNVMPPSPSKMPAKVPANINKTTQKVHTTVYGGQLVPTLSPKPTHDYGLLPEKENLDSDGNPIVKIDPAYALRGGGTTTHTISSNRDDGNNNNTNDNKNKELESVRYNNLNTEDENNNNTDDEQNKQLDAEPYNNRTSRPDSSSDYVSPCAGIIDSALISPYGSNAKIIDLAITDYQTVLCESFRTSKEWKKIIKEKTSAADLMNQIFPFEVEKKKKGQESKQKENRRNITPQGFQLLVSIIHYYAKKYLSAESEKEKCLALSQPFSKTEQDTLDRLKCLQDLTINLDAYNRMAGITILFDALNIAKISDSSIPPLFVKRVKFFHKPLEKSEIPSVVAAVNSRKDRHYLYINYNPKLTAMAAPFGDNYFELRQDKHILEEGREFTPEFETK